MERFDYNAPGGASAPRNMTDMQVHPIQYCVELQTHVSKPPIHVPSWQLEIEREPNIGTHLEEWPPSPRGYGFESPA